MIEIVNSEFVFVQDGEFVNPRYIWLINGELNGEISFKKNWWRGRLVETRLFEAVHFEVMSRKLDELNESLENERSKFFGF